MRRIGRAGWLLVATLVGSGPATLRADDAPKVDLKAVEAVDRVLSEWHLRASKATSIEAMFRKTEKTPGFEISNSEGRLVLSSPNLALFDTVELDKNGKQTDLKERLVWDGNHFLRFEVFQRAVYRHKLSEPKTPPRDLCLPFMFQLSVEAAKQEHDWQVLREDEKFVVLRATRKRKPKSWFDASVEQFIIELDKSRYLPKRVILADKAAQTSHVFQVVEVKTNALADIDEMKAPCLDSWKVIETPAKFLKNLDAMRPDRLDDQRPKN